MKQTLYMIFTQVQFISFNSLSYHPPTPSICNFACKVFFRLLPSLIPKSKMTATVGQITEQEISDWVHLTSLLIFTIMSIIKWHHLRYCDSSVKTHKCLESKGCGFMVTLIKHFSPWSNWTFYGSFTTPLFCFVHKF